MKEKINNLFQKIKQVLKYKESFFVIILIFSSTVSFLLGKISEQYKITSYHQSNIKLIQTDLPTDISKNIKLVASKKGKKYHLPWCSGAINISEKNKIFFDNKKDAEKAGYQPAKNCEGL